MKEIKETKETTAKLEFVNDKDRSIYAWTSDGPYRLVVSLDEAATLKNDQTVKVKYEKYGQYAKLVSWEIKMD